MSNFFDLQEKARTRTRWYVFFFALAVVITACLISFALGMIFEIQDPYHLGFIALGVAATILVGSFWKLKGLSEGGISVGLMLGGRLLDHESAKSSEEKQFLNVVEEMAIASGAPVPPVFIMDNESGINAFAAGFRTQDAIIGITRGALNLLSRDELQAVVAHEFSHIVNGDMRLNMRLMGMIYGLLLLTLIGGHLLRARGRSKGVGGIILAGLVLYILGWIGYFWGRIFQASVSRQREFLADASSVQFTRNPQGIIGALTKIGGTAMGSLVAHEQSSEARHFFFSNAFSSSWFYFFETHPPLTERIRAINPRIRPNFQNFESPATEAPSPYIVQRFSKPIAQRSHDLIDVQTMILALLVSGAKDSKEALSKIGEKLGDEVAKKTLENMKVLQAKSQNRLEVLQICLPTLARYSKTQLEALENLAKEVIRLNPSATVFDFAVLTVLAAKRKIAAGQRPVVQYYAFSSVKKEMGLLLSTLAYISKSDDLDAFRRGAKILHLSQDYFVTRADCKLSDVTKALDKFSHASVALKKKLVEALTATALSDALVKPQEWEFLRAASIALDCPLPPLDSPQKLVNG